MNSLQFQSSFTKFVQERHTVRQYQNNHTIPTDEINEMIKLAQTAPSAWNLQHWRVIVVRDSKQKQLLHSVANGQQQVIDASAVFIILGDLEANKTVEAVYQPLVKKGNMSESAYHRLANNINQAYQNKKSFARDSAFLNASLFAMQLMLVAKAKGYDTCPMGGFQSHKLVEVLHIPDRFVPVMMITMGIASAPARSTTRLPLDEIVIHETF